MHDFIAELMRFCGAIVAIIAISAFLMALALA